MVSNATFNNISVISWASVLLVQKTGENHRPAASHRRTLSHDVVSSAPRHEQDDSYSDNSCILTCCLSIYKHYYKH
jgi:hypothetical protein